MGNMSKIIKVALIGLDTSHTIEFARRMAAPDCPADQKVGGLRPVSCLRFPTPFQGEDGLNERQRELEGWGIKVTTRFDEAVEGSDALMLEINDPARHLEYFTACADLGKMIFLDKPLADNIANGRRIFELAKAKNVKVFSMSALRLPPPLVSACAQIPRPQFTHAFGAFGRAPAGSSIVWYGVHTFEMLERAMGRGAQCVFARGDGAGVTALVQYPENRGGVVELRDGAQVYGGCLRYREMAIPFISDMSRTYTDLLKQVVKFFQTGKAPVEPEDTLEVMAMLDAAQRSLDSKKEEAVRTA
jgi:predicted dehydrogenase